jgi:hypothetical protein
LVAKGADYGCVFGFEELDYVTPFTVMAWVRWLEGVMVE